jgi:hypothetical protein
LSRAVRHRIPGCHRQASRIASLSGPLHHYAGIRPPMHPALRRYSSVKYFPVFSLLAPCRAGASAPSVRHRNDETDHLTVRFTASFLASSDPSSSMCLWTPVLSLEWRRRRSRARSAPHDGGNHVALVALRVDVRELSKLDCGAQARLSLSFFYRPLGGTLFSPRYRSIEVANAEQATPNGWSVALASRHPGKNGEGGSRGL